jgi:hypothetical protein
MLHEWQQTISMRSNVREWTHVLLVNITWCHLHSLLRNWRGPRPSNQGHVDSSVTGRGLEGLSHGVTDSDSTLCCSAGIWFLLGCVLNWTPCRRLQRCIQCGSLGISKSTTHRIAVLRWPQTLLRITVVSNLSRPENWPLFCILS